MASLQQVKWGRLGSLNDDVLSTFQINNSFGILCCKSIKYFNNRTETWNNLPTHFDFELSFANLSWGTRIFDSENKRMYLVDNDDEFKIMDFELKTSNTFRTYPVIDDASSIIVDNKLHVIGGKKSGHYIWNESLLQFELKTSSEFLADTQFHRLIYLPSRKIILLIGGTEKEILSYCTIRNTWSELSVELPEYLSAVSAVVTRDDKYVIIFGGRELQSQKFRINRIFVNSIYVLNIKMMKLSKCTVKCPVVNVVQTAILNDCDMEKLTTFGYVRDCWKNEQYKNMLFPPFI